VVGADVVLRLREVDAGLSAVGRVHLGDEARRDPDPADAALVDGGAEPREVADDAAADRHHEVLAAGARRGQEAQHLLGARERLLLLARRQHVARVARDRVHGGDVLVGHDEAAAVARVREPGGHQPAAEEDRVVAGGGRRPREPRTRRRVLERPQRGQRAAYPVARQRRQRHRRQRLVDGLAVALQLLEAAAVARQRAALPGRPPPGLVGADLEVDDRMPVERVAHALRRDRAAPERDHASVRAREQLEHDLLLARAEGGLALAVEEALDRLAERLLELAVGVERLHAELGGGGARGGRLPGSHEPDEDERAPAPGAAVGRR
jgi:hypothetical protein